jgi:hypothetical protein
MVQAIQKWTRQEWVDAVRAMEPGDTLTNDDSDTTVFRRYRPPMAMPGEDWYFPLIVGGVCFTVAQVAYGRGVRCADDAEFFAAECAAFAESGAA